MSQLWGLLLYKKGSDSMSGRSSFATPTNVYPKNGQVIVTTPYGEGWSRGWISFTNNTDSLMFIEYQLHNLDNNWWRAPTYHRWYGTYGDEDEVQPFNRGETYGFQIIMKDGSGGAYDFGHYTVNLSLYSSYPHTVNNETIYLPNINVKKSSGKILEVTTNTKIKIAEGLDITPPVYFDGSNFTTYPNTAKYIVRCDYISVRGTLAMITAYNSATGECELFEAPLPYGYDNLEVGMSYFIYCNYISTSGSSSEGTYDFYIRNKIQSASYADPIPGAFRCLSQYNHPDNIGLEKYRFKIFDLIPDNPQGQTYINGTIQSWVDEETGINKGCDYKHIPIEKNLNYELKNKRIIIGRNGETGRLSSGDWGEIVNYDSHSGLVTLKNELESCPHEGQPYTIELEKRVLIADSGDCYTWKLAYNFPLYLMGKKIMLETILTSYEKQVSDTCITITYPEPELDYDYGQENDEYSIVANPTNQTVELTFKESIKNDDRFFGLYRKTRSTVMDDNLLDKWEYIGFIREGYQFTDYLAANNSTYDYLISKTVKYVDPYSGVIPPDPLHEFDYDPAEEYKGYAFENAVSTKWDGWSITAIYPCENDYINEPIDVIKCDNGHTVRYDGEYKSIISQFVCSKTPYKVGDTWRFYSAIDSGEIVSNLNRNVHVGTSTYPTVSGTNNKYQNGTFTTELVTLDCATDKIYDNIEKVNKWLKFITDDCLYILKSDKGDVWIVAISDNPSRSYDESVDDIITKVSYSWTEVDSPENIQIVEY